MRPVYPKTLHPIYKFHAEGKSYVADMAKRKVLEITPVMWDILELCTTCHLPKLLENLSLKYKESSIFEGIERLEHLGKAGLLFEKTEISLSQKSSKRLKLFSPLVSVDWIEARQLPFLTNANHYHLLRALGKVADVHINIREEQAQLEKEEGIFPIVLDEEKSRSASPVRFVPEDCDGILLLSGHPTADLPFFLSQEAPVICRIESDVRQQETVLELALNAASALREWDALCVESSWLKDWLKGFISRTDQIVVIPNGVEDAFLSPIEKTTAKQMTAQIFGSELLLQRPVVGILSSDASETTAHFVLSLARRNTHLMFLVLDSQIERLFPLPPDNVFFFGVLSLQERELLPMIFNSFDLFCFSAFPGTSISLVLSAMACGVPTLVIGEQMPSEMCGTGVFVQSEPSFSKLSVPFEALSEQINSLLKANTQRAELVEAARQTADQYTWERTAQELLELFHQLNQKKEAKEPKSQVSFPVVFARYYDKGQESTTTLAFQPISGSYQSVEEGLAQTLLKQHSLQEVECVLRYFCKEKEK